MQDNQATREEPTGAVMGPEERRGVGGAERRQEAAGGTMNDQETRRGTRRRTKPKGKLEVPPTATLRDFGFNSKRGEGEET